MGGGPCSGGEANVGADSRGLFRISATTLTAGQRETQEVVLKVFRPLPDGSTTLPESLELAEADEDEDEAVEGEEKEAKTAGEDWEQDESSESDEEEEEE